MAFGYRNLREWSCEHCSNFKILTQTIMSAMLMRALCFPFLFSVFVDNYLVFLLLSMVKNLFKHDRKMNLMKYYTRQY
jgi:hypothetical protein